MNGDGWVDQLARGDSLEESVQLSVLAGFQPFMIEGALLSHDTDLTRAVEEITGAVRPGNLAYMLLNAPK